MKLQRNVLLKKHTTFRIGGPAKYFFVAKTKEELIKAVLWGREKKTPFFILGGGSNLLVADGGYNGLVIKMKNSRLCRDLGSQAKFSAEAGVPLAEAVTKSAEAGFSGLEWAAGIPGTVGGAVRGNAGAFEGSMANVVKSIEAYDVKSTKTKIFKNQKCQFGYRNSIFKKNPHLIILSCELQLKKGNKEIIKQKIKKYLDYRQEKHPKEPSAGSVFKNIGSIPAALLIHQCGLSGKKIGGAEISRKHSNFIINSNKARAKDVLELMKLAKKKVKEKFGIKLEEEIQFIHN